MLGEDEASVQQRTGCPSTTRFTFKDAKFNLPKKRDRNEPEMFYVSFPAS